MSHSNGHSTRLPHWCQARGARHRHRRVAPPASQPTYCNPPPQQCSKRQRLEVDETGGASRAGHRLPSAVSAQSRPARRRKRACEYMSTVAPRPAWVTCPAPSAGGASSVSRHSPVTGKTARVVAGAACAACVARTDAPSRPTRRRSTGWLTASPLPASWLRGLPPSATQLPKRAASGAGSACGGARAAASSAMPSRRSASSAAAHASAPPRTPSSATCHGAHSARGTGA
eukprot:scaffold37015_cov45-Phaeocystis_antarctica.AAC.1